MDPAKVDLMATLSELAHIAIVEYIRPSNRSWAKSAPALEIALDQAALVGSWLARRIAHVQAGRSRVQVCHEDPAAWLPST
jgi:Tfp pilus assembly protein FimV